MSRRSVVVARYEPCDGEAFEVRIEALNTFPDSLDEARAQAVRGVRELIVTALAAYPADRPQEPAEE